MVKEEFAEKGLKTDDTKYVDKKTDDTKYVEVAPKWPTLVNWKEDHAFWRMNSRLCRNFNLLILSKIKLQKDLVHSVRNNTMF